MNQQRCPHCGSLNPPGNTRCQSCRRYLTVPPATRAAEEGRPGSGRTSAFQRLKGTLSRMWTRVTGQGSPPPARRSPRQGTAAFSSTPQQPMSVRPRPTPSSPPPRATQPMALRHHAQAAPPPVPQERHTKGPPPPLRPNTPFQDGRFLILTPRQLEHVVYYDALDLRCGHCQTPHERVPPNGLCRACHQPLQTVLIHEHHLPVQSHLRPQMLQMGNVGHPKILHHLDVLTFTRATFTVLQHPGQWGVVVRGRRPRPIDDALAVVGQVAHAFTYLHQQGFAYTSTDRGSWQLALENVLTLSGNEAKVADLSPIRALPTDAQARQQAIAADIAFLGQLLLFLSTDLTHFPGHQEEAPPLLHPVITDALQHRYPSVTAFLQALREIPEATTPPRPLKPLHGQATHPGRRHQHNEDAIVTFTYNKEQGGKSVPIGFYLVADGMGGHEAGDLASRTVNQIVTEWVLQTKVLPDLRKTTRKLTKESITEELLQEAIQRANQVLLHRAKAQNSNLGSTVTAALIIGNAATVVNVGDSRTYLLRQGQLQQVTRDHSLVARLVEANVITPGEVREHPRRNEIYRSLGQEDEIEVDTFTFPLKRGDRLILCCDGLWEMVEDAEIKRIIEAAKSPQQACDALIHAANRAGGEDNISVIVVEME
ncbi:MAG: Stp1/IreP family PP2C-type Ser/Thr phosphatase [Anaerolineae bacterium]